MVQAIICNFEQVNCSCICLFNRMNGLLTRAPDSLHSNRLASLMMSLAVSNCLIGDVIHPLMPLVLSLFSHLMLLQPCWTLAAIQAADHVGRATLALIKEVLISSKSLFC